MAYRYRFGPYSLDPEALLLERDGRAVPLRPKLVETLVALVEAAPGVASKDELMRRVWPDVTVVESSLTRNISELRSELEAGCPGTRAIETLPKRGYRFLLPVVRESKTSAPLARGWRARALLVAAAGLATVVLLLGARTLTESARDASPEEQPESVARAAFQSGFALYDTWTLENVEAASFHFERSIRAAPELWYGHYGSSMAQMAQLLLSGDATPEAKARLLGTVDRAVLYGPEAAATHAARGAALLLASWDWQGAEREIDAAIEWNPKNSLVYERRALLNTLRGRFDDARADYDRALTDHADFDDCRLERAFNDFCARRYDDAVKGVLDTLPRTKKRQPAHRLLALAYGARGDWRKSQEAAGKAGLSNFDRTRLEAWSLANQGNGSEANAARDRLLALCREQNRSYCDTAVVDVALGGYDAAFASLEEGLRQRHWSLLIHSIDPRLDPIRQDTRWERLIAAIRPAR